MGFGQNLEYLGGDGGGSSCQLASGGMQLGKISDCELDEGGIK